MVDSTPNSTSTGISATASATARKSRVPNVKKIRKMPRMKPQSPTRLTMNAFLPASDAVFL